MNTELFIARHILSKNKDNFSRPIVKIAIISIALGLAVMIIAVAIVTGFQFEIREKVIGFGSHIQISNYDYNKSFEDSPISKKQSFYPYIDTIEGIRHIQVFANKAGIIKTKEQIQGVVLKGVGADYDWSFFGDKIVSGEGFIVNDSVKTDNVIISRTLSKLLKLKNGDDLRMYFVSGSGSQPRGRKFSIKGIYETELEEFDKLYVICDIKHIQKLNRWTDEQIGGFEVLLDDFDELEKFSNVIYNEIGYDLNAKTIKETNPQIFEWLGLQDMNVVIILVLMALVAGITMISTLLILILERTNMIGILKALGSRDASIRKIFLYNASYIVGRGLLWGNIIGIGLCLLQDYFQLITLNQESYYVSFVPVNLSLLSIIILNAGTFLVCLIMLIIPSLIITRISPVKAIRFS
ncbi:MAG: FtsX-like permease family protein, partial [Bacteroidales bacterium]|nr:FtsX-like permease family protein [Bacteroidales bacterium]